MYGDGIFRILKQIQYGPHALILAIIADLRRPAIGGRNPVATDSRYRGVFTCLCDRASVSRTDNVFRNTMRVMRYGQNRDQNRAQ